MEASRKEKKLTPKQEKFAQAVASGTSLKEAAVLAGYSHKNAGRAGAFLANNEPLVQRRIDSKNYTKSQEGFCLRPHTLLKENSLLTPSLSSRTLLSKSQRTIVLELFDYE